jgi:hypothetical protein
LTPPYVNLPGVIEARESMIALAYLNPFTVAGMSARLYYAASDLPETKRNGIHDEVMRQARDAPLGPNGGTWSTVPNMPALVIPNVYRCTVEGVHGGRQIVNVFGLRGTGPGLSTSAATALQTAWKVAAGPLTRLPPTYALTAFRALDLSSLNGGIAVIGDTSPGSLAGGVTATSAASALIKWNGGTRSRSSRGRTYFGPLTEGQVNTDGRSIAAGDVTSINNAFTAFRSSLTTSGFTLCVISQIGSVAFDVTSQQVQSIIATQRRRIRS